MTRCRLPPPLRLFLASAALAAAVLALGVATVVAADPAAVADGGKAPLVISPADPASIQRGIEEAARRRATRIVIPPGVYRIPGGAIPSNGPWAMLIHDVEHLEIEATGVTLLFLDPDQRAIQFKNCRDVTFRGATLRRTMPPCVQGTIEAVDPAGEYVDLRLAKGYPSDLENKERFDTMWCGLYSADGQHQLGTMRSFTPPRYQRLDDKGLIRISLYDKVSSVPVPVTPGLRLAWRRHERDDIQPLDCAAMKFIDITVAGGDGMVFHETGGDGGNLYRNCKVTYGERPEGATEDPIFATSADGLHSHDMVKGPIVENCLFEGVNDDAIAIHGTYAMAAEASGRRLVAWAPYYTRLHEFCKPGETLRLYDKSGKIVGTAKVVSVNPLKGYQTPFKAESVYRTFQTPEKDFFNEVIVDTDLPPDFVGGLIANADRCGSGYIVRNCTIRHCPARGIMAKGSDGLIENNTFEELGRAGVEFMTEMEAWSESDYVHNVIIRNNTFRRVALNRQAGYLRHPGAITIFNFRMVAAAADMNDRKGAYVAEPGGHRNILIEGNTFEDVYGPNLLITSAKGVTVRNNTFVRPMPLPTKLGTEKGVDVDALVYVTQSSDVTFSGNHVIAPGPAMKKLVSASDTAKGQGFSDGVVVDK